MTHLAFSFAGVELHALPSGALFWPEQRLLCVSDLHLGRSERIARHGGQIIPPYENTDTLARLDADIAATLPETVVCLGDSFDDLAATGSLTPSEAQWISRLQAGRRWIWIEGNHDPAPLDLGGSHLRDLALGPLTFRHIAEPGAQGEISGHYHPKFTLPGRGGGLSRPAFLFDENRLVLPAYGTYTGGMAITRQPLRGLVAASARVILTGPKLRLLPAYSAAMSRKRPASSRPG